jgi:hypothetical protein
MIRTAARELRIFAFYLALAMAMTWPLARHLDTALADLGDPLVNMWIIDWVGHALTHQPLDLYDSPLYYPGKLTLAYSENLVGVTLFVLPLQLLGVPPLAVYNIALLLGFAFSGYGAFVLARVVTRSTAAALVGGVIFAFVPFKFDHLSHMQLLWSGWIPLLLATVLVYWREPSRRHALYIAAAFAMNGLTNVHYFLFGSFTAVAFVALLAVFDPRRGRRFWIELASAFVLGGVVLLPFLIPYRIVSNELGLVRSLADAESGSAPLKAWLVTTPRSVVYGELGPDELHRHEMQLFPGLVAIFLGLAALVKTRPLTRPPVPLSPHAGRGDWVLVLLGILTYIGAVTEWSEIKLFGVRLLSLDSAETPAMLLVIFAVYRFRHALRAAVERSRFTPAAWVCGVAILIGFLGSLGMSTFFHAFLFRRIGPFQAIRAPVRWAVIAYVGLAVWAAIGALALTEGKKYKRTMAALLVALAALDLWPATRWEHVVPDLAPVYTWLDQERMAPFVELPSSGGGAPSAYLLGSTGHHLPQFNGVEVVGVPDFKRIRNKSDANEYDDELLTLLERHGCRLVVIHAHAATPELRAWLSQQSDRLAFVRSFDHEIGGDFVFAVTRNVRDWQRLRAPESPDGAGHLPSQKLARMLAGQSTHSDAIIAHVETPQDREQIKGALHVRGWALSPFPIKRVILRIHNGKAQYNALSYERPDVKAHYHWYYFVPRPGFSVTIPKRPDHVPRQTEFQVEVEDNEGRVMRTKDVLIDWE